MAREARDEYKSQLSRGLDPLAQRAIAADEQRTKLAELKAKRAEERAEAARIRATFERLAIEWIDDHRSVWTAQHAAQVEQSLRDHVFPKIEPSRST